MTIRVALVCILVLPSALHAQTSNVTLYGRINADFENITATNATNGGSVLSTNRVSSDSTRFGIRGTEDLAGSLKAIFQVESGLDASANSNNSSGSTSPGAGPAAAIGTIATRDTYVGLDGDFGTLRLGLIETPYKNVTADNVNILYDTGIHSRPALQGNCSGGFASTACFYRRQNKSVRYDTPRLAGFSAAAHYAIESALSGTVGNNQATLWSGNLRYANGPFRAAIAYERHNGFRSSTSQNSAVNLNDSAWTAIVTCDFGAASVALILEKLKYEQPNGDLRRDYRAAAMTVPLGLGAALLEYGQALDGKGSVADGVNIIANQGHGPDTGAKQYMIGYEYDLSKRTQIYAYYTKISNRPNADFTFAINSFTLPGTGSSPSGYTLGIAHNF